MSQFGGQPVDTGSQFGGTPLVDVSQQDNPALAAKLNNLYWRAANAVGHDSPQAQSIMQVMRNAGVNLSSPTDPAILGKLDAGAAQNTVNDQGFGANTVQGFGKSFVDTGRGLQQIGAQIADKVDHLAPTTASLVSGVAPTRAAAVQSRIDQDQSANSALNGTYGGFGGQFAGGAAQLLVPVGDIAGAAGVAAKAAPYVNAAIKGAAYSGLQAVPTGGSRTMNTAVGGAIPLALPIVPAMAGALVRTGGRLIGSNAAADAAAAKLLANAPNAAGRLGQLGAVPGYTPTAAESLLGQGGNEASAARVQAEQRMRTSPAGAVLFSAHDAANHAAHVNALAGIAGTDVAGVDTAGALDAAKAARESATQPYIDANLKPQSIADRFTNAIGAVQGYLGGRTSAGSAPIMIKAQKIMQSVKNGSMQEDDAMKALNDLHDSLPEAPNGQPSAAMNAMQAAKDHINQGMVSTQPIKDLLHATLNSGIASNADVASGINAVLARIAKTENTRGMVSADVLNGIRQSLKSYLPSNPATGQPNGQALVGLGPVKTAITDALDRAVPGYRDYLAAYAKHSEPINTMQAGRDALATVLSRGSDSSGAPGVSLPVINRIIKDAEGGDYPIASSAIATLKAIRQTIQNRGAINNTIGGTGGSRTASAIMSALPQSAQAALRIAAPAISGGVLGHFLGLPPEASAAAGSALATLGSLGNARLQQGVAARMANAQLAARAVQNSARGPALLPRLYNRFNQLGAPP